ncbi:MAG: hypothetical protein R3Y63_09685 [Eubacteriales bacterium]
MLEQITPILIAGFVMFAVIGALIFFSNAYNLDGIKSKTVGDGQHGTARFATKSETHKTYKHIPFRPKEWREGKNLPTADQQGIILGCTSNPKTGLLAMVDSDDVHCMMIGASGIGKTAYFLYPNLGVTRS